MSDDRNNDFDDFQGFDGSNDFGDLNADGMHFSEEELEAAMAGFEQEFKDAEASKHERADNPPSEAFDSSEASDNAESSESSESSEVDDMLNAAEDCCRHSVNCPTFPRNASDRRKVLSRCCAISTETVRKRRSKT